MAAPAVSAAVAPAISNSIAPFHGAAFVHPERGAQLRREYDAAVAAASRPDAGALEVAAATAAANAAASAAHPSGGHGNAAPKSEEALKQARVCLSAFLAHEDAADPKRNYRVLYASKAVGGIPERLPASLVATEVFWKDLQTFLLYVHISAHTRKQLGGSTIISHLRDLMRYFAELDVARAHEGFYRVLASEGRDNWLKTLCADVERVTWARNNEAKVSNVASASALFLSHTAGIGRALFRAASNPKASGASAICAHTRARCCARGARLHPVPPFRASRNTNIHTLPVPPCRAHSCRWT